MRVRLRFIRYLIQKMPVFSLVALLFAWELLHRVYLPETNVINESLIIDSVIHA